MAGTDYRLAAAIAQRLVGTLELKKLLATCAQQLGLELGASRCVMYPLSLSHATPIERERSRSAATTESPAIEWSLYPPHSAFDKLSLKISEEIAHLAAETSTPITLISSDLDSVSPSFAAELRSLGAETVMACCAHVNGQANVACILYREAEDGPWESADLELLEYVMSIAGTAIENCQAFARVQRSTREVAESAEGVDRAEELRPAISSTESRYQRLVEQSDAIFLHVELDHRITYISRRALDFFGVPPKDFLGATPVHWFDLIHLEDRERVQRRVNDEAYSVTGFEEEFRVINHITGRARWLLAKFVPVRDKGEEISGWDGFGIDITSRREAQEALDAQSKKVRALYTVSSAVRGFLDPANIASRGLAALCDATGADAGLCYLYPGKEAEMLSLVAHHGFSADFIDRLEANSTLPSLSSYVAEHGQSVVVPDVRSDPRANKFLADEEGMRSAVLVPVAVEEETLGTLGLFHREAGKFDGGDVMLVTAAASQIGLAARQANLFSVYRKQTKNLSALYRLSHELSGFLSLDEIFHKAFAVIRDELGLKRLWLGLLNETGTRVIGQAAYGPGWKRRLVEINVEIRGREHPIARVISGRKPIIIDDPEKVLSEFGVKRFFSRFSVNVLGLVPLISGGQVLGVLAFQPGPADSSLGKEEMTLLSSLSSEIAAVVLAKRLEERIGSGEKMRTAGLLAAGIAHNFNNLLQAILGQASLLEIQSTQPGQVVKAARIINDSATKGASLVRQLMSFANLEEAMGEVCDVNAVVERSLEQLSRQLRGNQRITTAMAENLPSAYVDPRQVVRILTSLVSNATEAMESSGEVQIFTDSIVVDRRSPHFEVPYGEYVRVGVRDDGRGMDAETKKRCFEPFFTTKNVDPGSGLSMSGAGLGLAAAYALARKNGGRLVTDSRKGHGSVFTLYVPVKAQVERVAEEARGSKTSGEEHLANNDSPDSQLKLIHGGEMALEIERLEKAAAEEKIIPAATVERRGVGNSKAEQIRKIRNQKGADETEAK